MNILFRLLFVSAILFFAACGSGSKADSTTPPQPEAQTSPELAAIIAGKLSASVPGATIAVIAPNGSFVAAAGKTGSGNYREMTPGDRMRIASMTKTFVAATALRVLESNSISIDSHVSATASVAPEVNSAITFRQLMGMTAGLPEYMDQTAYDQAVRAKPAREIWSAKTILGYIAGLSLDFTPGTRYNYSNTNYIALQDALESITGETLATLLRREILDPSGLDESFLELWETKSGGFGGVTARGYESGRDVTELNDGLGLADGGIVSTALDLATFMKTLAVDKSVLSASALARMTDWRRADSYGLGLELVSTSLGTAWGHTGSAAGFSGGMLAWPDRAISAAILLNNSDSGIDEFSVLTEAATSVATQ